VTILILLILGILICSVLTGFFAGAETGAISANRLRLRNLQLEGDQRADDVIALLSDTQSVLTVTLVGTNVFSILAALFAKQFFTITTQILYKDATIQTADLVSLVIMTPFLLIFGEIIPKQFFREHADNLMLRIRTPLKLFSNLFIPAVSFFNSITYLCLKPFGISKGQSRIRFTKEDLRQLVGTGENNGSKDKAGIPGAKEVDMIQSIFSLEKTLVREVMKPLVDVIALPLHTSTVKTALETARRSGYSRLPVYENTIVNMVGYVDVYEILRSENKHTEELGSFVRSAYYIPETKRIDDLLQELLSQHISVAIAFDEYGGCSGFVTLEDILEEIVGEIEDEFDKKSIMYYEEKPGVYNVDSRMDLDDLREELNITLPKRECDTISGFIYNILGRVPREDEMISYGKYRIRVLETQPPKIKRVRIEQLSKEK